MPEHPALGSRMVKPSAAPPHQKCGLEIFKVSCRGTLSDPFPGQLSWTLLCSFQVSVRAVLRDSHSITGLGGCQVEVVWFGEAHCPLAPETYPLCGNLTSATHQSVSVMGVTLPDCSGGCQAGFRGHRDSPAHLGPCYSLVVGADSTCGIPWPWPLRAVPPDLPRYRRLAPRPRGGDLRIAKHVGAVAVKSEFRIWPGGCKAAGHSVGMRPGCRPGEQRTPAALGRSRPSTRCAGLARVRQAAPAAHSVPGASGARPGLPGLYPCGQHCCCVARLGLPRWSAPAARFVPGVRGSRRARGCAPRAWRACSPV